MSNFESFYGGRQGASFVIVKRFDAITIPEGQTLYRKKLYALHGYTEDAEPQKIFKLDSNNKLIEKTSDTYYEHEHWGSLELRQGNQYLAAPANDPSSISQYTYSEESVLQEGMTNCFAKGGLTTNIVNYGEYVIIDTIFGKGEYENPDNGKVFYRGFNKNNNEALNGAKYVGQIVGSTGKTAELSLSDISEIMTTGYYDEANTGIVPGKYFDFEEGTEKFHDKVTYGWVSIKDEYNNIQKIIIGFSFPYLVPEFSGTIRSPYYESGEGGTTGNILPDTFDLFVDNGESTADRNPHHGDTGHPYYRKWKLRIPKGVKGDTSTNFEIYPTKVAAGVHTYSYSGGTYIENPSVTVGIETVDLTNYQTYWPTGYVKLYNLPNFVKLTDTYEFKVKYKETNYDTRVDGVSQDIIIGNFDQIRKIDLAADGTLTVYYDYMGSRSLDQKIKWINSATLSNAGVFDITYNDNTHYINNLIWPTNLVLVEGEGVKVIYNNGTEESLDLVWVQDVELENDGSFNATYSDGNTTTLNTVKWIDNITVETTDGEHGEGSGDQKIHVTYNTETNGQKDTAIIGEPLNYIMDSVITGYTENVQGGHLLVYYSDPQKRVGGISYGGRDGWVDLGYVKGEPGGLHFIGVADSEQDLYNLGEAIPPEMIGGNHPEHAGWGMLIKKEEGGVLEGYDIYVYNYLADPTTWVNIGTIQQDLVDPTLIIQMSESIPMNLNINGFWIVKTTPVVYYE